MDEDEQRRALLGSSKKVGLRNAGPSWSTSDDDEDDEILSIGQYRDRQTKILNDQERGLEALSEVISRQKHIATTIHDEVDFQNDLIDNITDNVDRTRDRLVGETGRIRTFDKKDSTCKYWTVILLLLLVIVIIAAI